MKRLIPVLALFVVCAGAVVWYAVADVPCDMREQGTPKPGTCNNGATTLCEPTKVYPMIAIDFPPYQIPDLLNGYMDCVPGGSIQYHPTQATVCERTANNNPTQVCFLGTTSNYGPYYMTEPCYSTWTCKLAKNIKNADICVALPNTIMTKDKEAYVVLKCTAVVIK